MQKKIILLATFVEPKYLEKFLSKLLKKFSIKKERVFIFETEDGDYLLTYRIFLNVGQRIDIRKEFRKTIQIHKIKENRQIDLTLKKNMVIHANL